MRTSKSGFWGEGLWIRKEKSRQTFGKGWRTTEREKFYFKQKTAKEVRGGDAFLTDDTKKKFGRAWGKDSSKGVRLQIFTS